jgi:hypothetical protein
MVIPQHPAESLAAMDSTVGADIVSFGVDQSVVQALVIPLPMVVGKVLDDSPPQ